MSEIEAQRGSRVVGSASFGVIACEQRVEARKLGPAHATRLVAMTKTRQAPRTQKVRPDVVGGKHGAGHLRTTRVRRPDPGRIQRETSDQTLTRVAGLVSFGSYVRRCGLDRKLARTFDEKKPDRRLVYPMSAQIPLALDSHVADETGAFGIGALAGVDA